MGEETEKELLQLARGQGWPLVFLDDVERRLAVRIAAKVRQCCHRDLTVAQRHVGNVR